MPCQTTTNPCSISRQELICNFPKLLPSGPLWDTSGDSKTDEEAANCTSLTNFARFCGAQVYEIIQTAIWPALRENHPLTAYSSLDDWLEILNWNECYNQNCGGIPINENGKKLFERGINFGCNADYTLAIKSAIAQALYRMRNTKIPTLSVIRAILAPLKVNIEPCQIFVIRPKTPEITTISLALEIIPNNKDGVKQICMSSIGSGLELEERECENEECDGLVENCANQESLKICVTPSGENLTIPRENCDDPVKTIPVLFNPCELENGEKDDTQPDKPFYPNVLVAACMIKALIYNPQLELVLNYYGEDEE